MMSADVCMFGGLGMEGKWFYFDQKEKVKDYLEKKQFSCYPKLCLSFGQRIQEGDQLYNLPDVLLYYDDRRCFGNFTIASWSTAFEKMKEIGPDMLATTVPIANIHKLVKEKLPSFFFEQVTFERFLAEIGKSARKDMNICKFLMENKYLSACGNYLLAECLYRSRLSPFRSLGSFTQEELQRLHVTVLNTVKSSYQCKGLTHGNFLTPNMEKGTFPVYVYKREGEFDPNGYKIQRIKGGHGRSVFYVPEIQL